MNLRGKTWTELEIEILKKNYIEHGVNYCLEKLSRSRVAIKRKAVKLGLSKTKANKKWTKDEEDFLRENYYNHGADYCANALNRSNASIRRMVGVLQLKREEIVPDRYEKTSFELVVKKSKSYTEVARGLGLQVFYGNRQTIKKYIKLYDIDISHFDFGATNRHGKTISKPIELTQILVENSTYGGGTTNLKERLYGEGLKERKCELCGQGEIWQGKQMSLILDHINGINNDNRIENLQIVCPNCEGTLVTHCKGNSDAYKIKLEQKKTAVKMLRETNNIKISLKNISTDEEQRIIVVRKDLCLCGNEKTIEAKVCTKCYSISRRTTNRPPYEQLLVEVGEIGYRATGRNYGVSDNSIRKWIKDYEKYK